MSAVLWRRLRRAAAIACAVGALLVVKGHAAAAASLPTLGSSGPAVLRLQLALNDAGANLPLTGYFGSQTRAALLRSGIEPEAELGLGARGATVKALQRALTRAGYPLASTGVFGPYTAALVRKFQRAHGLPQTGTISLERIEAATPLYTLLARADALVGTRYAWGGTTPHTGFDCSGLIHFVFNLVGVDLPHSSYAQADRGMPIRISQLLPGDLVFFNSWGFGPSHVGIYLGGGLMVHSGDFSTGVTFDSLAGGYWADRLIAARRLLGA